MGIYDRNYFRGSSGGWGSGPSSWPPVCKAIVLMNIGVFIAQILITRLPTIEEIRDQYGVGFHDDFVERYIDEHKHDKMDPVPDQDDFLSNRDDDSPKLDGSIAKETGANSQNAEEADNSNDESDELRRIAERKFHELLADQVVNSPRASVVQDWLELDTNKIKKGQIWRILTSAFCHDRHGLWHILFNMLGLIWFGIALEHMYGDREFLLFYLTAAIISGLAFVGLDLWTGESVPAIGASGAVMAVLMLFTCHYPTHTIRIWFLFPIEMRWLVLLYVAWDLHPVLLTLAGDNVHTGVAHAAHLGGLAFGFVYWNQRLRLTPLVDSIQRFDWRKKFRRNPRIKLHTDSRDERPKVDSQAASAASTDQDTLDELLIKISREGRDNLTPEELEILNQASERLRQKKGN